MNERELLKELARDVQSAAAGRRKVLYLEGKSDAPILLALLGASEGRAVSNGVLHDALLNGKWLVEAYAPRIMKLSPDACRDAWTGCLREVGGDPEIKAWWQRTVAPPVVSGA